MGVTKERIRQIQVRAMGKLREAAKKANRRYGVKDKRYRPHGWPGGTTPDGSEEDAVDAEFEVKSGS